MATTVTVALLAIAAHSTTTTAKRHLTTFTHAHATTKLRARNNIRAVAAAFPNTAPDTTLSTSPDAWIPQTNLDAFRDDVAKLGKQLEAGQSDDDTKHLHKMISWSNACAALGIATMGLGLNPLSAIFLSLWSTSRWTMIAHHTCHGGYNKQSPPGSRFTSVGFALGTLQKRACDWLDWMLPEAWNVEHNNLHHFRLGEPGDPDLVERNLDTLRTMKLPMPLKYAYVAVLACMWKWYYYAPNTYKQLKIAELKRAGKPIPPSVDVHAPFTITRFLEKGRENIALGYSFGEYARRVALPYAFLRFVALPAPLLLFSRAAFVAGVANLLLADVLCNIHTFVIIATNHAGEDLYAFENSVKAKSGSYFMRQVVSSANFRTGGDLNDFMHGWLNYQIEHHAWPQLSMLSYQKAAPQLKAICDKHGVPYIQESVFLRLKKTVDIMVGKTSMRKFKPEWEKKEDAFEWK